MVKFYMKEGIHPKYYEDAKIQCACGAIYEVGSTRQFMKVEVCSKCHPFFTGKEKIIDKRGRVEKFKEKLKRAEKKEK